MFDEKDLILDARHVTRRFMTNSGRELTACSDVNLKMYKGKTLGLVGESGCGKSTFMRFLVWLDRPSEGEIIFHGKDITKLKGKELWEERQHIQMVFQDPSTSFNPKMTIRDIICEPLMNFGRIKASEKDAKARELRLHFVWKREDSLLRVVERLNNFEAVNIAVEDNKIIVK